MKLLLDTHTCIWLSENKPALNDSVKKLIEDSNNTAYISIVSLWEMSIKISLGKLLIATPLELVLTEL